MQISEVLKNKTVHRSLITALTFTAGAGLGYILGKRAQKREGLRKAAVEEIAFIEKDLDRLRKERRERRAIELANAVANKETEVGLEAQPEVIESSRHSPDPGSEKEQHDIPDNDVVEEIGGSDMGRFLKGDSRINVFTITDRDWDYDRELANRTREEPYVIHQEEFINDERGFQQETLTYYAGDDIMADGEDTPIYDYAGLMGELKFGHGSKDPNVVYIRNEVLHMEWEILLHRGSFSEEVLGLELEEETEKDLKHSVLKFRRE